MKSFGDIPLGCPGQGGCSTYGGWTLPLDPLTKYGPFVFHH
jgi:hypothetical protein